MAEFSLDRINELYNKSKTVGLTEEEKIEQQNQRKAYMESFRTNLRGSLDNIKIQNPDGTIVELKKKGAK